MGGMKTRAAVCRAPGKPWEVTELDLDEPKANEVLVRLKASGLCHSDEHVREGIPKVRYPIVGGHEGAGIVEAVGPGVTRVQVGDHIATSFIPACGKCRYCATGHQNLCDRGLYSGIGCLQDETFRYHDGKEDLGGNCTLGTFSERAVFSELSVVKIDDDIPFEVACLFACGVPTGWGSAVYAAQTVAGDTVVVIGVGGVGIHSIQGARLAGAKNIIAIDPVPFKLEKALELGATFATSDPEEARQHIINETRGQMADHAIITVGNLQASVLELAVSLIGKACDVIVTSVARFDEVAIALPPNTPISNWQKRIQGALFGTANPLYDIPKLLGLYRSGDLKIDEIITRRYTLDEINEGYQDMLDGKNIRGVIIHD